MYADVVDRRPTRATDPCERLPALPAPSQIVFNGEFTPPRQSRVLKRYEAALIETADRQARRHGMDAAAWLRTPAAMAGRPRG